MSKKNTRPDMTQQAALVLEYLEAGRTLTPMIAMVSLGIGSLTARIAELRRCRTIDGKPSFIISDEWSKDHFNRRYKTYWIGKDKPVDQEPAPKD